MSYGPNRIVRIRRTPGSNFAAWNGHDDELPAPGVDGPGEFRCVKLKSRVLGVFCCNVDERRGRVCTGVSVGLGLVSRVLREDDAVGGGGGASLLFVNIIVGELVSFDSDNLAYLGNLSTPLKHDLVRVQRCRIARITLLWGEDIIEHPPGRFVLFAFFALPPSLRRNAKAHFGWRRFSLAFAFPRRCGKYLIGASSPYPSFRRSRLCRRDTHARSC